jgi:hypothetical protein
LTVAVFQKSYKHALVKSSKYAVMKIPMKRDKRKNC